MNSEKSEGSMKQSLTNTLWGILTIVFLMIIWEVSAMSESYYAKIFPPPSKFLTEIVESDFKIGLGSQASSLSHSIFASVYRVVVGLLLGFTLSIYFGFLISYSRWAKRIFMPVIRLLAPIAPIAWIPLALVLFGVSNTAAFFLVFMGVFFMLTIATVRAIRTVPVNLIYAARTLGSSDFQTVTNVVLPSILPEVFTILRLNFIAAWMAVLAAEMTGLRDGLGAVIMTGRNLFNNEMILAGMLFIGVTGFCFDIILKFCQDKFFWW